MKGLNVSEKLPQHRDGETDVPKRSKVKWIPFALIAWTTFIGIRNLHSTPASTLTPTPSDEVLRGTCRQAEPILPHGYNVSKVLDHRERLIEWLRGAVRIPTEVFDDMGPVDEDPRWHIFGDFHDYLEKSFPLIHKTLNRTKTDWALVYEWPGSDPSLKPFMLTAHQDVVPVLPYSKTQWIHDPYGAYFDGTDIWGRGAYDTKGSLIPLMASIEHLLETTDFKPRRTIVLAFGTDEEAGGRFGAPAIAKYLLGKYGPNSMAMIVDEGSGLMENWGRMFGMPGVAEKGHYDLGIEVKTLGGHSSNPPLHSGIGYLSMLITALEANPHAPLLTRKSPVYGYMTCAATHASGIPDDLRSLVVRAESGDAKALAELPDAILSAGMKGSPTDPGQGVSLRSLMSTTQAVDLISGGLKINALPESAQVAINHRVNVASNHSELQDRTVALLLPIAEKYNLTVVDFDGEVAHEGGFNRIIFTNAFGYYTEPSPVSSTDVETTPEWAVLAGVARGVWASRPEVSKDGEMVELEDGEDLVMAPFMTTGNTDTRRYWDLTNKIYRWRYHRMEEYHGAHTINERASADGLVEFARYYQAVILAMDQATTVA